MASSLRRQALRILNAAVKAVDPKEAVLRHVTIHGGTLIAGPRRYSLSSFRNIYVVGAGKAGAPMAQAMERLLGRHITQGSGERQVRTHRAAPPH